MAAAERLDGLRWEARSCRACDLWRKGTQTVFGEGPADASAVLVGEQPGDREDREGRPFVGPAGALLDRALEEAGIDRARVYVTNAVKHFNWEPRGKRRIHKKPNGAELSACRPWLDAELEAIEPAVVVCLGATAAQALLGREFRVSRRHGEILESRGRRVLATVHPSSILRAPDEASRHAAYAAFVEDLRKAAPFLVEKRRLTKRRGAGILVGKCLPQRRLRNSRPSSPSSRKRSPSAAIRPR